MGETVNLGDLRFLLADLSAKADAGDAEAELRLNELASQCTPEVCLAAAEIASAGAQPVSPEQTLGDILGAALTAGLDPVAADEWDAILAAAELIAGHYLLSLDDVWSALFELEHRLFEDTGMPQFGRLLERPWGYSVLAFRVAELILGVDEADRLPCLSLTYH